MLIGNQSIIIKEQIERKRMQRYELEKAGDFLPNGEVLSRDLLRGRFGGVEEGGDEGGFPFPPATNDKSIVTTGVPLGV